jgi:hypothetical protein
MVAWEGFVVLAVELKLMFLDGYGVVCCGEPCEELASSSAAAGWLILSTFLLLLLC